MYHIKSCLKSWTINDLQASFTMKRLPRNLHLYDDTYKNRSRWNSAAERCKPKRCIHISQWREMQRVFTLPLTLSSNYILHSINNGVDRTAHSKEYYCLVVCLKYWNLSSLGCFTWFWRELVSLGLIQTPLGQLSPHSQTSQTVSLESSGTAREA